MAPNPNENAFGAPGMEPRWTHGNKNGVGTAYSASSKIWFTLSADARSAIPDHGWKKLLS